MATLTRKCLALAFLSAYVLNLGCSSVREVPTADALSSDSKVYSITLKSYEVIEFDDEGGRINSYRGTIDGKDRHLRAVSVKLDDVRSVRIEKTNTTKSVAVTVLVLGAMAAAFAGLFGLLLGGFP